MPLRSLARRAAAGAGVALLGGAAALWHPLSARAEAPQCGMAPGPGLDLVQLCVVHRHGARTPFGVRSKDEENAVTWLATEISDKTKLDLAAVKVIRRHEETHETEELSPETVATIDRSEHRGKGALKGGALPARLTLVGMQQAVELGERLRARYLEKGFLTPDWQTAKEHVYVRSTSTERTIETAQGVLSGMFPSQISKASPATIFLRAEGEEEWGSPNFGSWCPRLQALWKQGTDQLKTDYDNEHAALLKELQEKVDMDVPAKAGAFMLTIFRDEFFARDAHGKPLPKGSEKIDNLLDRLQRYDAARMRSMFAGGSDTTRDESTRLNAGRMLIRIIETLNAAPDDTHRLVVHSGHDWTIIMLLLGLDPEGTDERTRDWPPFCSDLVFERWEDAKARKEYVRVVLNGEPLKLHHLVAHPDHDLLYTKESLHDALEPFLLAKHEIEEACKMPPAAEAK